MLDDKNYFYEMVNIVRDKLNQLSEESYVRQYFPEERLAEIREKITDTDSRDLEWGSYQPFFCFLYMNDSSVIRALDEDLNIVSSHADNNNCFSFLEDKREQDSSWSSGLFEVRIKAGILKSSLISNIVLDWRLPNGRDIDIKSDIGNRSFCLECTTLGESDAGKARWENHCESLKQAPNKAFVESQDAYSPGRRLYDKVYDKIAPRLDTERSQLSNDHPNFLAIGLSPIISDLRSDSPSIGWALDELFSIQPTGNNSSISLEGYLRRKLAGKNGNLEQLFSALSLISGILVFDGYQLGQARINYNTRKDLLMSHQEMAIIDSIFSHSPPYLH